MTTQPEALRLAVLLDINHHEPHVEQAAAAELRRLHAEVEALRATQGEQEPVVDFPHEQMDALALARYKVVPSDQSMYWRHAVVAGDGQQHLYNGSEVDCQNMARKFAGAFLDGAFAFHSRYTSPVVTQGEQPMVNMTPPATARDRWMYEQGRLAEREIICAAIKAEDDHCVTKSDYMLDSDDCIKVARGQWVRPVYEDAALSATSGVGGEGGVMK